MTALSAQLAPASHGMQRTRFESREILTAREREVLGLTAEGLTSKEMALRLGISPRTADVHRAHVIRKLGLRNRVEAVRYAMKAGILGG